MPRRAAWLALAVLVAWVFLAGPARAQTIIFPPTPATQTPGASAAPPSIQVQAADPRLAARVDQLVRQYLPQLEHWLGAAPKRLTVVVAADQADFIRRATELGGPRWAAGLAVPDEGLILLRPPRLLADPGSFELVLAHELVHLGAHAALGRAEAPTWLQEGLAMWLSGQDSWGLGAVMARLALTRSWPALAGLEDGFPGDAGKAQEAYAYSYYFTVWLLRAWGAEGLREVMAQLARGRAVTAALWAATGTSQVALEERFRGDMSRRFGWVALLGTGALWGLVALGAAVGLLLRRRAQKRRMARMIDHPPLAGQPPIPEPDPDAPARPRWGVLGWRGGRPRRRGPRGPRRRVTNE